MLQNHSSITLFTICIHVSDENHSTLTIIILVYAFDKNKSAKVYLPSTFQTSDIELLSPKIET